MRWLVKHRMTLYRYVMVLYVVALNSLFYTSGNLWIMMIATIGNILAVLAILGFSFHEKVRKIEREERCQQRKEHREIRKQTSE
ncbi:hypothetical protein [Enterococcus saccharolyticus]|uniref:Uncharacterized protein n=1 Tax=Enterococcus saccharolyticus subsp. saccharolyticus ATCC 43076 TaxID=1139996 RepID=S0JCZ8_9ENTE|nr:hypothetical protein [Enterococcus saccharolyticus]EOT26455.1 hypothetical protein OMQ_02230 [Enterococcus saccharolyticus subsp. saccharolyticus ATCC 43076]EOT76415.1 hypothetical protein I572_02603 [Enterococcus saccharolyticus subsp. saccharolyticus ATCC 43076]